MIFCRLGTGFVILLFGGKDKLGCFAPKLTQIKQPSLFLSGPSRQTCQSTPAYLTGTGAVELFIGQTCFIFFPPMEFVKKVFCSCQI